MMEAPERIWAIKIGNGHGRDMVSTRGEVWDKEPSATEYVRADLVRKNALLECLAAAQAQVDEANDQADKSRAGPELVQGCEMVLDAILALIKAPVFVMEATDA